VRTARAVGLALAWVLSVCLVAGVGCFSIGLAGQRIGVVSRSAMAVPPPADIETGSPVSEAGDQPSPGSPSGLSGAVNGPTEGVEAPLTGGSTAPSSPEESPPSARPTGADETSSTLGRTAGPRTRSGPTATRRHGGSTTRRTSARDEERRTRRTSAPATTTRQTDTARQSDSSTSDDVTWGSYEDRGGQVRLACSRSGVEDWRVLPAVGWSAKAVVVDSGEMWAVLFREDAGTVVKGTCRNGRPTLRPLLGDQALVSVGDGGIIIQR
jgi:hypothetical protein